MVLRPDEQDLKKFQLQWNVAYDQYLGVQRQLFPLFLVHTFNAVVFTVGWLVDSQAMLHSDSVAIYAQNVVAVAIASLVYFLYCIPPALCSRQLQALRKAQRNLVFEHSATKVFVETICSVPMNCFGLSAEFTLVWGLCFLLSPLLLFALWKA